MSDATLLLGLGLGALAGGLGALFGIGGGVFLVPALVLFVQLPIRSAVGISLVTVIAMSSVVSVGSWGRQIVNVRLGMLLEVATAAGGLAGGVVARLMPERAIRILFSLTLVGVALALLTRLGRRNVILDPEAEAGVLGGRFFEAESGALVTYRVRRLPVAVGGSLLAGILSSLLGIGGGIVKVPLLNVWCGVPLRVAAATSAFMIGVTAAAAAPIYYARGDVAPPLAAAAVLGVLVGSRAGFLIAHRARARWLKLALAIVLLGVAALMSMG